MDFNPITYAGGAPVGMAFDEISKAFAIGYDYVPENMTGGAAGRIQSLQGTYVDAIDFEQGAAFFKELPKETVTSPVIEYANINEVGGAIFYPEGGSVDWQGADFSRKVELVKYVGVLAEVTEVAAMTKTILPAEATEFKVQTRALIRGVNLACIESDSDMNPLAYDGVFKQVKVKSKNVSQHMIDLRGKPLTDEIINDAVTTILDNYGFEAKTLFAAPAGINGYVKQKMKNKTYYTNAAGELSPSGQTLKRFDVANGEGRVVRDIFFRAQTAQLNRIVNKTYDALIRNHEKAPDAPTAVITSEASTSVFSMDNGIYKYAVVPINGYGRGAAYEGTITHSGGGKRTKFVVTEANTGNTLGYEIYRRAGSSTDIRDYALVSVYKRTGASTTIYDDGEFIPGTSKAFMTELNKEQVISVAEYGDYMKLQYGRRADKTEWLLKKYLSLVVKNANRMVCFYNVGSEPV